MSLKEIKKILAKDSKVSEALLVGCFYNDYQFYLSYTEEKLNNKSFLNDVFGFYFNLGRYLVDKGITKFSDIEMQAAVNELGSKFVKAYDEYGGYDTVKDLMIETEELMDNFNMYYSETKKYELLYNLSKLFGEKIVSKTDKYDYVRLNRESIFSYWMDKLNSLGIGIDNKVEESYLLERVRERVKKWDEEPNTGLPFYDSDRLTKLTNGFARGNLYLHSGYSGTGKTSFITKHIVMSHIEKQEKLLLILNEQSSDDLMQYLLMTIIGQMGLYLDRQRLNQGEFTEDEMQIINKAIEWIEENVGDEKLIVTCFLEDYNMVDVERLLRKWKARNIHSVVIDTAKPEDSMTSNETRWQNFYESVNKIYQLIRSNAGGLDMSCWLSMQSADATIGRRYLDEGCLGESRKVKNLADVLLLSRWAYQDEYDTEDNKKKNKNALECWRWVKNDGSNPFETKDFVKVKFKLNPKKKYQLLFPSKNRRGKALASGASVIVYEVDLNLNSWKEVGYTMVRDDR